jgi:predicted O-methyltransferase YrrM
MVVNDPYNIELLPLNIEGWFKNECKYGLANLIYRAQPKVFIELGSWMGESAISIARAIPENGILYCVDTWMGSKEHANDPKLLTLYNQFLSNIVHTGLKNKVVPIQMRTDEAITYFYMNNILADAIYIDASHEYEDVVKDIENYWPIVRPGGVLCGDDHDWPDVKKAVDEFLIRENLQSPRSTHEYWEVTKS